MLYVRDTCVVIVIRGEKQSLRLCPLGVVSLLFPHVYSPLVIPTTPTRPTLTTAIPTQCTGTSPILGHAVSALAIGRKSVRRLWPQARDEGGSGGGTEYYDNTIVPPSRKPIYMAQYSCRAMHKRCEVTWRSMEKRWMVRRTRKSRIRKRIGGI